MKNLCSPVYTEQVQRVAVGINVLLLTAGVDFFCQVGDRGRAPPKAARRGSLQPSACRRFSKVFSKVVKFFRKTARSSPPVRINRCQDLIFRRANIREEKIQ